VIYTLHFELLR